MRRITGIIGLMALAMPAQADQDRMKVVTTFILSPSCAAEPVARRAAPMAPSAVRLIEAFMRWVLSELRLQTQMRIGRKSQPSCERVASESSARVTGNGRAPCQKLSEGGACC